MTSVLARDVVVDLGGARILDGVSLDVAAGEWVAIVGPNGAGKSTLLRAVAGLVPAGGSVELDGRPIERMSRRERAKAVALVPQVPVVPPGVAVSDYVLLGRTPHMPPLGRESQADLDAVREALEQLDLVGFADRALDTLSGGERQRVLLARALAQASPVLLLDEPTSALDVGHQQDVLELVDRLRASRRLTVISTMHDLTLAGQYADRLVLLDRGAVVTAGSPDQVLTEENLARFYGAKVRVVREGGSIVVVPVRPGVPGVPGVPVR